MTQAPRYMYANFSMQKCIAILANCFLIAAPLLAQNAIPEWCRPLPRPEYKNFERVPVKDAWFEVYRVAPGVFAIYEPHQSEETISYLIAGEHGGLLFDTGMGIGDLRKVVAQLTPWPV